MGSTFFYARWIRGGQEILGGRQLLINNLSNPNFKDEHEIALSRALWTVSELDQCRREVWEYAEHHRANTNDDSVFNARKLRVQLELNRHADDARYCTLSYIEWTNYRYLVVTRC